MLTALERDLIMARLIAAGGPWLETAVFVGAIQSLTNNGINTVMADIVQPTGDPGVRVAVTNWSAAHIKLDGRSMVDSPVIEFRPADNTEGTTIAGFYAATLIAAGVLIVFYVLPAPVILVDETTAVQVVLHLNVDPNPGGGVWDTWTVMNG